MKGLANVSLPVVFEDHIGVLFQLDHDRIVRFDLFDAVADVLKELKRLGLWPEDGVRKKLTSVWPLTRIF